MRRFYPKAVVMLGVGVLCVSDVLSYYDSGLADSDTRPSGWLVWIVFGSGFLLTGVGLLATAAKLDRKRRKILAVSLLVFGCMSFFLGLAIAHVGFVLLVFAVPALVWGAIISAKR